MPLSMPGYDLGMGVALLGEPEPRGLSDDDIEVTGSSISQKVAQDPKTGESREQ